MVNKALLDILALQKVVSSRVGQGFDALVFGKLKHAERRFPPLGLSTNSTPAMSCAIITDRRLRGPDQLQHDGDERKTLCTVAMVPSLQSKAAVG
jgi:hypothetical protein